MERDIHDTIGDEGQGTKGTGAIFRRRRPAPVHQQSGTQIMGPSHYRRRTPTRYRPGRITEPAVAEGRDPVVEKHAPAMPALSNTHLDRIYRRDLLRVLTPIWTTRPETALWVRLRMRTVFRWAEAHGFMESNPAGEVINGALPPMPKVRAHFRALPYQEGRVGTRNCGSVRSLKPR